MSEKSDLIAIAEAIAAHLPGYRCDPETDIFTWRCALVNDAGHKLAVKNVAGAYASLERVEIAGLGGATCPRLTASVSRGGKAIAADITRKLLPDYLEALSKAADNAAAQAEAAAGQAATVAALRETGAFRDTWREDTLSISAAEVYGDARVGYAGSSVDLHLRGLAPALAVHIAAALVAAVNVGVGA